MKTISLAAAQVERWTTVVVTRRGEPILEIRPIAQQSAREAVASIRGFRERPGFNRNAPFLRKGETVRRYAHRGHTK